MKTTFVIPSMRYWSQPTKQQPLTNLYLMTIIDRVFEDTSRLCDLRGADDPLKVEIPDSDLYLYSVNSPDFAEVKQIIKKLRKERPRSKHIGGGAHINIFPEESIKLFDSIVLGDGEESIIQLVQDHQIGNLNSCYKVPRKDEKKYPFPRRDYLDDKLIVNPDFFKLFPGISATSTLFSKGCPFKCSFCANYRSRTPIRRSDEQITKELDYLKSLYSIDGISMMDEICIPLVEKEALSYLEVMGQSGLKWKGQVRSGVPLDMLKRANQAGCLELSFGVESASQAVVNLNKKRIKLDEVKRTIHNCHEAGIKAFINLINGLPGESSNIVEETKRFVTESDPDLVALFSFCPYPGSEIYDKPLDYGIRPDSINRDFSTYVHHVRSSKNTKDDLDHILPFEYLPQGPLGRTLNRKQITANLVELQQFILEHNLNRK